MQAQTQNCNVGVDKVEPGDIVVYNVTVSNNGDAVAHDLYITDTLPIGFDYVNNSVVNATLVESGSSGSKKYVKFYVGNLSNSSSITVFYNTTVSSSASNISKNSVILEGFDGMNRPIQPTAVQSTVIVNKPKLEVKKSSNKTTAEPGDFVNFTLNLTTNANLYNFTVTDLLPANFEYISAQPAPLSISGQQLTFNISQI
ncbi:MAG: hypothetical protein BWK75_02040, partial [Candidatus Altiarchaeales archaeon A3]